jgi:hypothetical protein
MTRLSLILIILGLCLLVLSWAWPVAAPPGRTWTEERAKQHSEVSVARHNAAYEGMKETDGHSHGPPGGPGLEEAKQRYDASAAELQVAKNSGSGVASWCCGLGVLVSGAGVAMYFVARMQSS